jgi:DNA-binding NarL/FixJ family response regulator
MQDMFVDDLVSEFDEREAADERRGGTSGGPVENRVEEAVRGSAGEFIALIESRVFLRECIRNSVQVKLPFPVRAYATVAELTQQQLGGSPQVVMLSVNKVNVDELVGALEALSQSLPETPVIVLAYDDIPGLTRTAIQRGAKGYIPFSMGFNVVVAAVHFILAGGTYVPTDVLLETESSGAAAPTPLSAAGAPTSREAAVIRAIQKGLSNKVIAYDLNMCESTVKVHIRNIMRKMKAKNRTDIAIKAHSASFPHH